MVKYGFSSRYKLLKTDEYSSVFSFRRRVFGDCLVVHYMPNRLGYPRLGMVIGKKIMRRAVDRNYVRRVVREWFRIYRDQLGGIDLVVRLSKPFERKDYPKVAEELKTLLYHLRRVSGQVSAG